MLDIPILSKFTLHGSKRYKFKNTDHPKPCFPEGSTFMKRPAGLKYMPAKRTTHALETTDVYD